MNLQRRFRVQDPNGVRGTLFSEGRILDDRPLKPVRLEDGRELMVPSDRLEVQPDGSYRLGVPFEEAVGQSGGEGAALAPEKAPGARIYETGGESESVKSYQGVIEQALLREDVDVERVPVNRVVEQPPEIREEGDTLIVPVLEEVLEKRLMVREEVHIRRRREEKRGAENIVTHDSPEFRT